MQRLYNYSQNFLRNPRLVKELIKNSLIKSDDIVIDIGAGSGVISSCLAEYCKKVISVEIESSVINILRKNMSQYKNVEIRNIDFLSMELPEYPYKIFSNIPFHISSEIIRKITENSHPPEVAYLIVQKQLANKLIPDNDGFTSQLGAIIGPEFNVTIKRNLLRTDFYPRPNVDTSLIEIKKRQSPLINKKDIKNYKKFICDCFNNIEHFNKVASKISGFEKIKKPSQMKLRHWINLFNLIKLTD